MAHKSVSLVLVVLCIAFFVSACPKPVDSVSKKESVPVQDARASELDQHGFYKVEWDYDIEDGDIDSWPASLYSKANSDIRKIASQIFPNHEYRSLEVRIVPHFQGYTTLVLSRRKLTKEEQDQIRSAALAAMSEARERWVSGEWNKAEPASTARRP